MLKTDRQKATCVEDRQTDRQTDKEGRITPCFMSSVNKLLTDRLTDRRVKEKQVTDR